MVLLYKIFYAFLRCKSWLFWIENVYKVVCSLFDQIYIIKRWRLNLRVVTNEQRENKTMLVLD